MFLSALFSLMFQAQAAPVPQALAPIPIAKVPQFSCDKIEPVPCGEILNRLQIYRDNIDQHESSLLDFISSVQTTASNWYDQLSPLENQDVTVPADYFSVVSQGAEAIQNVTSFAAQNRNCMKKELDEILKAMRSCKSP